MTLLIAPPNRNLPIENRKLLHLLAILLLVVGIILLVTLFVSQSKRVEDTSHLSQKPDPFKGVAILAKSAVVYDVKNDKVIFEKHIDDILPLASLTKLLTMVTAEELLPENTVISIKKEFLDEEGDNGLYKDENWKLSDLMKFSLMVSSNDGASAIAAAAAAKLPQSDPSNIGYTDFLKHMNEKALTIGMNNSHFYNVTGLDISKGESGGYGTSLDMAKLIAYVLKEHPEILSATRTDKQTFTSLSSIVHSATNTDTAVDEIPGLLASKTGFTDAAGGNLAIVFDPGVGRPIAVVVLGSTYDGRFDDILNLTDRALKYVNQGN